MAAMSKKQGKRLRRWQDSLSEIEQQLVSAHLDRTVWAKTRDGVVQQHPEADAHFIASYSRAYVVSQVTRLRDLSSDKGSRSMPQLIRSIRKNPEILSKDNWVQMVADDPAVVAADPDQFYDSQLGDEDGQLSKKDLRADIRRVRKATDKLPGWTSQVVDHLDRRSVYRFRARDLRLGYNEIDDALEELSAVAGRLQLMLRGRKIPSWELDIQADWQEPLRASLFPFEDVSFLLPPSGEFT
jgi:hypothetical protein